jgi:hypothetical protein
LLAIEAHVYYSCIKNVLDELIQVFLIHSWTSLSVSKDR